MAEMTVKRIESKEELFALLEENNYVYFSGFNSHQDRNGDAHVSYGKHTWDQRLTRLVEEKRAQDFPRYINGIQNFCNVNGHVFWFGYENTGNPEFQLEFLLRRLNEFIESGENKKVYRWNVFEENYLENPFFAEAGQS